jgi:hypothetical protein
MNKPFPVEKTKRVMIVKCNACLALHKIFRNIIWSVIIPGSANQKYVIAEWRIEEKGAIKT